MILPIALKIFLQSLFASIEHYHCTKELILRPQQIRLVLLEQLNLLVHLGLIKKSIYPKIAWCNRCDVSCEIKVAKDKKFLICYECGTDEELSDINSMHYSTSLAQLSKFLQNLLELQNAIEVIHVDRLLYLGYCNKAKYYLLCGVQKKNCQEILENLAQTHNLYILCLENNHSLKYQTYNILDFLSLEDSKLSLDLPEIIYQNTISSMGGKEKSKKYSGARKLIIAEFEEIQKVKSTKSQYLKITCNKIADKLRKNPDLIIGLKDDNLERFVQDTLRTNKKLAR